MQTGNLFRRYLEFVVRRRLWVIAGVALATLFLASRITTLKIDMDPDIWAPQAHPYVKATLTLEQIFGGRNLTLIGIIPKDGDALAPNVLAKVQRIQTGIEKIPEAVKHNVLSLAAPKVKAIRGAPDGMEVRPMLAALPGTAAALAELKQDLGLNPIYTKALVSSDRSAVAVIADFRMHDRPSYAALLDEIERVVGPERDASVTIHIGGLTADLAAFEHQMMRMPIYFVLALGIILAIQYWSFRSVQGMLLPLVTALASVVWGLGWMGVFGVHMDGMNTATPILIMAVAAGHAIQIVKRYYEEYARITAAQPSLPPAMANRRALVESLALVGPIMLTAGAIAAIAFLSLTTAGMSVVRHFGVFAGAGVLSAIVLEMTLIPAVRSLLAPPNAVERLLERKRGLLDRLLLGLARQLVGGHATRVLVGGLAVIAIASIGAVRLAADNSFKRYSNEGSVVRQDDAALNARFGGTNSMLFLIEGGTADRMKDPEVLKAMSELQRFLESQPHVGKTQSLADLIRRMHRAMHGDDPAYDAVPGDRNLIAQYLLLYSASGDPQDFENFVDLDYRRAVIWAYLDDDSNAYAQALHERAKAVIAAHFPVDVSVRVGGSLPQTIAINEVLVREKFMNLAQTALVVFFLASLVLRSFVGGLYVATPLALIILANFGIMGWLGVPLDMGTAGTASMAVGIGADYEIYLLFRFKEELERTQDEAQATVHSLLTSGKAIVFVALSVAGGYAPLLLSGFGFYTRLGGAVIVTMLVSTLCALIFLRSMMVLFKPRFVFGSRPTMGRAAQLAGTSR